jgi:hypothetical protein
MAGQTIEIAGLAAWIALSMPFAVLATTILLAVRRRRVRRESAGETGATGRYGVPVGAPRPAATLPKPVAPQLPALPTYADVDPAELGRRLVEAERRNDGQAAALLLLALARRARADGSDAAASEHLRRCIRTATSLGERRVHAAARLELGDIAEEGGDLTTACEHWQIARQLADELGLAEEAATAEARMTSHGCPTDWVLNDF